MKRILCWIEEIYATVHRRLDSEKMGSIDNGGGFLISAFVV